MDRKKELEWKYLNGKIGRRDFLAGATALGMTAAASSTILSKAAKAETPNKGGRFRMGLTGGATSDDLDPATTLDSYMINVNFGQLRNCLTEIAPNGDLIGEIAESWEPSADAATWAFKIRKDVEFHNGKTLNSKDVLESINHHRGDDTKSAAKGIIAPIEDVKTDGDHTVIFELTGGSADFPYLMSDYHLGMCPAKDEGGVDWVSGTGTGGYVLDSFEPGVRTLTKHNPNYWKEGHGHFDEVETLYIGDVTARTAALQTGEIDAMEGVDLKTVHLLKRSPDLKVVSTTGNQHITLPMLTDTAPFDNNDLRLALKYCVDREQWLKVILKGYGGLGNDHPIGPANQFRATEEELPQRAYDPEKAKFHLKKAGHDSIDLQLHMGNTAFEGAIDAGVLLSETARPSGVSIKVVREPEDGYWSNVWLVKPWSGSYWGGRPTEDWMFSQVYADGVDWNETRWSHEDFNKLLVAARAELDQVKRREMYVEMQRLTRDEGGSVIPLFNAYVQAISAKLGTPEQWGNNWGLDGTKAAERWWFS